MKTKPDKSKAEESPRQLSHIRNISHEYTVKVSPSKIDSEDALARKGIRTINQDSEFAEGRRIGSNEDIQEIDGEDHPLFNELTHEQQMELIARQEY